MGKLTFLFLFISLSVQAVLLDGVKITNTGANPVPVSVSGTPTVNLGTLNGAATAANQSSQSSLLTTIDSTLSSLLTRTPAQGQATMANSAPMVIASNQSAIPVTGSFFQATQPVSLAAIPLATGAATSAYQASSDASLTALVAKDYATQTTLSALNAKIPASPATDRTTAAAPFALRLSDGTTFYKATTPADTQPISVASLPLPTGAATETTLSALNTKVTAVNTGAVVVSSSALPSGAATSALQTTGNSSLSSIDTKTPALVTGRVPVDGSGVTQPVNGTVTSNIGTTNGLALDTTLTAGSQKAIARGGAKGSTTAADVTSTNVDANTQGLDVAVKTMPSVTIGSSALPTGAATETTLSSLNGKVTAVNTGAVVVSSSALPTGAATETTLSAMSAKLPATLGQKTMANGMAVSIASDQSAIPVNATLQTGSNVIGSLVANQSVNHTQLNGVTVSTGNGVAGTGVQRVTIASDNTAFPVNSTLSAETTKVIGTVNVAAGQTIAATNAGTFPVQNTETRPSSATVTSVASSASSVNLLASNANRRKAMFFNDSTQIAYIKFGTTASTTSYTVKVLAGGYYEVPTPVYTGAIDCIWAAANGNMRITEY